jgi:hypothetical protein
MPQYLALTYTADVDWWAPEQAGELAEYRRFAIENAGSIKASAVLHPTATATVVRVEGGRGGELIRAEGPYAETKEALTGYYLLEAAGLEEAIAIATELPAARNGAVEVRPVIISS